MAGPDLSELPEALRDRLPDLMRAAIAEARRADEPFGCVLADYETGELWAAAPNVIDADATAHAEINALRILALRRQRADRAILIATAEPCPMCAAAAFWSGVRAVVYGTSIAMLIRAGWRQIALPCSEVLARAVPPGGPVVVGGFLAEETDPLYGEGSREGGS